VAALDLEIRGAGNLLGGEQSGHIEAVGFDMYMKLLEQTIKELKGEEIESDLKANVNLRVDLRIDDTYIPDMNQRLTVYRRMAAVRSDPELRRLIDELRDRYGSLPESVLNLAEYASIRLLADRLGLESVDREGQVVVLKFRQGTKLDPARVLYLVQERGDLTLVPPGTLKLSLVASRPAAPAPPSPAVRQDGRITRSSLSKRGKDPVAGGSWWAARARAGEVTGGFTRDEIMRPATKEDPRSETGVFTRVSDLLRDLADGL
jgi:transcription-repair coupling factor (superfamily II helicase)